MNESTLELIKLVPSILTPLLILILGVKINNSIEKNKASISKEKDWQTWWAGKLLEAAHKYNDEISTCIQKCFLLLQAENERAPKKGHGPDVILTELVDIKIRLQYLQWELQNYTQFAEINGKLVCKYQNVLFDEMAKIFVHVQGV